MWPAMSLDETLKQRIAQVEKGGAPKYHAKNAAALEQLAKDYQEKLKGEGWEIESSMNMGDTSMVHAKKGSRKCAAVVMKDDAGTLVQLSVTGE